ncbi:hypothetical protein KC19_6G128100 [Ceratodon purpureus]|uniref:NAD(P)H-hydrate epimerase n=1 Tax=Ceratodon purpureus TaxID=3225 RepID=A0A8T0HEE7_CERPU|nr:hypothetical protein KC19_6G128100 [Ceratodon purpureus]
MATPLSRAPSLLLKWNQQLHFARAPVREGHFRKAIENFRSGGGESEVARAHKFQGVQSVQASSLNSRSTFAKPHLGDNRISFSVLKDPGPLCLKRAPTFLGHKRSWASASATGTVEQPSSQGNSQMASPASHNQVDGESISYLTQAEAAAIDETLMGELGFSIDQLMELAGLSVASAIAEVYDAKEYSRVLVICGPGNNGGDGLVAARHLYHFGYKPSICYPKRTDKPIYHGLVTQLESLKIPFVSAEELPSKLKDGFDLVIDAMFGFSFHGIPRPPFDSLLRQLVVPKGTIAEEVGVPPVVSVDIPSGWHVENGDTEGTGFVPDMLVSLTAPKLCAKMFDGAHHFIGGRFVPPVIVEKFSLRLPRYPGHSMCVRLGSTNSKPVDVAALRISYVGFELLEEQAKKDPFEQFKVWFDDAVSRKVAEPNAMTLATASKDGQPSARLVLLKGYDEGGFVWYTNYGSRKAAELKANPKACLVFFWEPLHRSVRIEGSVEMVSSEESDAYFHSRPKGSQIGALVSAQSSVIAGRHVLDKANEDLNAQYADGKFIPRPEHWGGFRLTPEVIEFWQGRESRLHDRLRYKRVGEDWIIERLSP